MTSARGHKRWLIALLSLLYPGLGHFYVGKTLPAALWFFAPHVLLLLLARPALHLGWLPGLMGLAVVGARLGAVLDVTRTPSTRPAVLNRAALVTCLVACVVVGRLGALTLRTFFVEAFAISSGAMEPSLIVGDHIFADKAAYGDAPPARGDVAPSSFQTIATRSSPFGSSVCRVTKSRNVTVSSQSTAGPSLAASWARLVGPRRSRCSSSSWSRARTS